MGQTILDISRDSDFILDLLCPDNNLHFYYSGSREEFVLEQSVSLPLSGLHFPDYGLDQVPHSQCEIRLLPKRVLQKVENYQTY